MVRHACRAKLVTLAVAAVLTILRWEIAAGEEPRSSGPRAATISLGIGRACSVLEDRSIVRWLEDWLDGELDARQIQYQQVSAGVERACGVTDTGRPICQSWGDVWQAGEPGSVTDK